MKKGKQMTLKTVLFSVMSIIKTAEYRFTLKHMSTGFVYVDDDNIKFE